MRRMLMHKIKRDRLSERLREENVKERERGADE